MWDGEKDAPASSGASCLLFCVLAWGRLKTYVGVTWRWWKQPSSLVLFVAQNDANQDLTPHALPLCYQILFNLTHYILDQRRPKGDLPHVIGRGDKAWALHSGLQSAECTQCRRITIGRPALIEEDTPLAGYVNFVQPFHLSRQLLSQWTRAIGPSGDGEVK